VAATADEVQDRLRATIEPLAALDRLPCSPGEAEAAQRIADALREQGHAVHVERDPVHGSYIGPILACVVPAAATGTRLLRRRRGARAQAAVAGLAGTALLWQDLAGGPRRWLRRRLPQAPTSTVVASVGPDDAAHTLVVHAHHDAARTSPIFDQGLPTLLWERFPERMAKLDRYPPLMWLVLAGPALVGLGALLGRRGAVRTGTAVAGGTAAVMAHMRTQPVVPGANDNLSGVALLVELGRRLAQDPPPPGVRVLLVAVGAEESNQDGMLRFMERHAARLPRDRTSFLCVDSVGSPELVLIEGEGFVRMRDYDPRLRDHVADAARDAGVALRRGLRFTFATDALAPLRQGYAVCTLGSVNGAMLPSNYHWPTDTAANVDLATVAAAVDVAEAAIRRLGG
jgi:hypothetical protein